MPLEKQIQSRIIDYLNSLPECICENVQGTAYASGRPDLNACYKGRLLRIEVKTPDHGNKATVVQEENLKRWAKAGAVSVVVYSLDEVKALVNSEGILCDSPFGCSCCPIKRKHCFVLL